MLSFIYIYSFVVILLLLVIGNFFGNFFCGFLFSLIHCSLIGCISDALYQTALDLTSEDTNSEHVNTFTRRLGNAKNELGVFYMNQAASLMETGTEPSNRERKLWEKSISYFDSGIHIFEVIQDRCVECQHVCTRF